MADSKETKKLRFNTPALKKALIPHIEDVAEQMGAIELLSSEKLATIQTVGGVRTPQNHADSMINSLKARVAANSDNYYTFLDILKELDKEDFTKIIQALEFSKSLI